MLQLSSICVSSALSGIAAVIAYQAYKNASSQDKIKKSAEQFLSANGVMLFRLVDLFELTRHYLVSGELFLGGYTTIEKRLEAILEWDETLRNKAVQTIRKNNVDWDDVVRAEFTQHLSGLIRKAFDPDKAGEAATNSSPHDMDLARALQEVVHQIEERKFVLSTDADYEVVD